VSQPKSRKYLPSPKRAATREQNRAAILAAAWEVFCASGLDAANIRDIVTRSSLAQGTFYNYFRTKEAVFESVSQDLLRRIRDESRIARAHATTLEEMLQLSYDSYLQLLQSIDGAMDFIARNQHHIRMQVQSSSAITGLADDLAHHLQRFLPARAMSSHERHLAATIVVAAGAESVLSGTGRLPRSTASLSHFLTRFVTYGFSGWTMDKKLPDV
jgi:AcrR family transcriptional regulator